MSPIGGVGVNLAVQDAVATANLLAARLASGCPSEQELDAVRQRREFPVRMTQRMQVVVQNNIIAAALKPGNQPLKAPLVMRLVNAVPWLQGVTARFVGVGVRPEHVQSPELRPEFAAAINAAAKRVSGVDGLVCAVRSKCCQYWCKRNADPKRCDRVIGRVPCRAGYRRWV